MYVDGCSIRSVKEKGFLALQRSHRFFEECWEKDYSVIGQTKKIAEPLMAVDFFFVRVLLVGVH